jgi:hypothetical protein
MASKGRIDAALNALPQELRVPLRDAFYEVLDAWRLGDGRRAENAQWYQTEFTTPGVAQTEFTVAHGMESAPGRFVPVLRLNEVGDQIVPLSVSRAADSQFVYLKSSSTGAVMSGYFE